MSVKILIIDDSADDREVIRIHLKEAGFEGSNIIEAATGEQGVEKAKNERPTIVITDTNMPHIDGFEACRKIKEIEGLETKVIIMTGAVDAVDAAKARAAGADDGTCPEHCV